MSGFYWYERYPDIYEGEIKAMKKYFPSFKLEKLNDGRLSWIGQLNPSGKDGGVWALQVIYDNDHPRSDRYGGSVRVYSIAPDLNELFEAAGRLPHVLRDGNGNLYMCTARMEDLDKGTNETTSAAKSLGWASKWIFIVEGWLKGELGEEVFGHTY